MPANTHAATRRKRPIWLAEVHEDDYPAAASYLSLLHGPKRVAKIVAALRAAPTSDFYAKDIFRASALSFAGLSRVHLEHERRKIAGGIGLSPILLVRDENHGKVVVADGYHRLCAVYEIDEEIRVPCKIV